MKKTLTFFLAIIMIFNLTVTTEWNVAYAVEPDVNWVEKEYDGVGKYNGGLAVVKTNDKFGYIDSMGKEIISLRYDWAGDFSEGLARVALNDKAGFINSAGKEIIPLKYDWAGDFSEGLARVVLNDKYGYIDVTGKEIMPLKYDLAGDFSEGLAAVGFDYKFTSYIDKTGKEVISLQNLDVDTAWDFSEGLAQIYSRGQIGYINKNGEMCIPAIYSCQYDELGHYNTKDDGIFQFYESIYDWRKFGERKFKEGLLHIRNQDWEWGYIDKNGKEIIPFISRFDMLQSNFSEGLAVSYNSDFEQIFIDKTGKEVLKLKYKCVLWDGVVFSEGLVIVGNDDNKYGYIDKEGKEIIPLKYDSAGYFSEGLAIVELNGKFGIIKNPFLKKDIKFESNKTISNVILNNKDLINIKTEPSDVVLTYVSKNPDIIKVSNSGEIIGLKTGTAEIEVIAYKDGYNDAKMAISVDVKEPLNLDLQWIDKLNSTDEITGKLEETLSNAEDFYFEDYSTLKDIVNYINLSIEKLSYTTIESKKNKVVINSEKIANSIEKVESIKNKFQDILDKNQIKLDRDMSGIVSISTSNLNSKNPFLIQMSNDLKNTIERVDGIKVDINGIRISFDSSQLKAELDKQDEFTIQIEEQNSKTKISFLDKDGKAISKLGNNITVELPVKTTDSDTSSVYFNDGQLDEQFGGQYNPVTDTISFDTNQAGEYFIEESQKEYTDTADLTEEEKEAIAYMTSKGFISDRGDGIFDPNGEITRAEFTAFMVRVFYLLDKDSSTSFTDVKPEDWYYDYVASSEKEGIINGFPDNTFKANDIINREQIVAVCARALHEKKKYLYPENLEQYLPFADSEEISDWAKQEVALALREMLVGIPENRMFESQKSMTRADATVIVYRLFQLLYEKNPSAIETIDAEEKNSIPILPIAGGGGGIGLGLLGRHVYKKRRKLLGK